MKSDLAEPRSVEAAVAAIKERGQLRPTIALVLGSGLGDFADEFKDAIIFNTNEIPGYPQSSVQGHAGRILLGKLSSGRKESPPLLVFQGRVHFYESGDIDPVLFPIRVAFGLGARSLIVTNAAGGIHPSFRPGNLMLLDDFLSLTFLNPLSPGDGFRERGPLSSVDTFDPSLQELFVSTAKRMNVDLKRGVYCWLKGPSYETAAEIEMLRRMGVDAVGMSTVPEIALARDLGMKVVGISLISNLATGIGSKKLSHHEVTETAERVKVSFIGLMKEVLLQVR